MANQEQLAQFRDIISKRPEEERKRFVEKFKSFSGEQKEKAIQTVLKKRKELVGEKEIPVSPREQIEQKLLPGKENVEQKISERQKTSAIDTLREEVMTPYSGNIIDKTIKAGVTGLKTMAVPYERGEAALANIGIELQRSPETRRSLWQVASEGLKGERLGEFGDIPRQVGMPEFLSSFIGLATSIKVADKITSNRLLGAAKKYENFVKSKFPRIMGKNFVLDRVKIASSALDDMYHALTKQYDDLFKKIGNKPVDSNLVAEAIEDLPENIIRKIAKSKLIRKNKNGELVNDIENLKHIRGIVRKVVPEKVWNGRAIGDPNTAQLQQIHGRLSEIMAQGNDDLMSLNKNYAKFMETRREVGRFLWDNNGNVVEKPLMNLWSKTGDRGKQVVFESFAQQFPQGQQVIKDIQKYHGRQAMKGLIKKAGATVAIGGLGGFAGGRIGAKLMER